MHAMQAENVAEQQAAIERTLAAVRVVEAERIATQVAETLKAAKDHHAALCRRDRVTQTETDEGDVVESLDKTRRNFSAVKLAKLVTADVFDSVTQRKVVTAKFDAAVELGTIDPKAVADAISETEYTATKVYWAD